MIPDISPAKIHPNDSEGDSKEAAGGGAEEALGGLGLGPGGPEPGHGEAQQQREGRPRHEEARGVLHHVAGGPRERERSREGLVLVDGLLLVRNRALCFGPAERER